MSNYILRRQKEHLEHILSLTGVERSKMPGLSLVVKGNVKSAVEAIAREPDLKMWIDRECGIPCLLLRNSNLGNWCGYVKLPLGSTHTYDEIESWNLEVHGEVSYVGDINTNILPEVRSPEFNEGGLWVGFDCAHWKDLIPSDIIFGNRIWDDDVYRTIEYAFDECTSLARQVALHSFYYNLPLPFKCLALLVKATKRFQSLRDRIVTFLSRLFHTSAP